MPESRHLNKGCRPPEAGGGDLALVVGVQSQMNKAHRLSPARVRKESLSFLQGAAPIPHESGPPRPPAVLLHRGVDTRAFAQVGCTNIRSFFRSHESCAPPLRSRYSGKRTPAGSTRS